MATVDIKNAVKAGMLEALAEQEAAKAHQNLVDFHEEHNSAPKADPMAAVIENQASIIELFKQFNERTSGIGNAATAQENYGQSGFAQQAMASSQNSMSLSQKRLQTQNNRKRQFIQLLQGELPLEFAHLLSQF